MKTADFDFELPADLIAQTPLVERTGSRQLVVEGVTGGISHARFSDVTFRALTQP